MLDDTLKYREIGGESLSCASRVIDNDRHASTCSKRKSHCHPMIIIRVNEHTAVDLLGEEPNKWRIGDATLGECEV